MRIRLHSPLKILEIAAATGGKYNESIKNVLIEFITTDTRDILKGDLFIAIKGDNFNGEDFIEAASAVGAYLLSTQSYPNAVTVSDTVEAFLSLANYYKLNKLKFLRHTVAITGSIGKTTTKDILSEILKIKFSTHSTYKNFNNKIGLPLTILSAPKNTEVLVLEMGMNHLGEIKELSLCAEPTLAIITNIGTSHIGNLGSREMIAKAKSEIVYGLKDGKVICEHNENLLKDLKNKLTISVSGEHKKANFLLNPSICNYDSCIFDIKFENTIIKNLFINVGSPHILHPVAFAVFSALLLGLNEDEIRKGLFNINDSHTRKTVIKTKRFTIYDDSYNSSYESVVAALKHIAMKNDSFSALLGDILELGEESEKIHTQLGKAAFNLGVRKLYLIGENSDTVAKGAISAGMKESDIFINRDIKRFDISAEQILKNCTNNEIILIKASNKLNLSRITKILTERS